MPEGMWCHFFIDACEFRIFFDDLFDSIFTQTISITVAREAGEEIFSIIMFDV